MDDALTEGRQPRYVHSKPSAATKKKYAFGEVVGGALGVSGTTKAILGTAAATQAPKLLKGIPVALKAVTKLTPTMIGTAIGLAARWSLLGAVGYASYFTTRWIIDNYPTKQRRLDAAADAYRQSRNELSSQLGRSLNKEELQALALRYKQIVAAINA
jgi:hypothetical protein